jgi:hypothetical protein
MGSVDPTTRYRRREQEDPTYSVSVLPLLTRAFMPTGRPLAEAKVTAILFVATVNCEV